MKSDIFCILALLTWASCNSSGLNNHSSTQDSLKTRGVISINKDSAKFESTEIICDTVYKNKGYKLSLRTFDSANEDETKFNTIFILYKLINRQYTEIFKDSIFNTFQEAKFEDFNNDKVKDILIQNFSDVRSNWAYYLYLVDTSHDLLKKIRGFQEIKNPTYIPRYDLIDNYVMSGRNWTSFYKIQGDSIKDFDIVIYDGENDNGKTTYDKDYNKAIKTILTKEKNR